MKIYDFLHLFPGFETVVEVKVAARVGVVNSQIAAVPGELAVAVAEVVETACFASVAAVQLSRSFPCSSNRSNNEDFNNKSIKNNSDKMIKNGNLILLYTIDIPVQS